MCVKLAMSGGTQVNQVVTHGGSKFEENHENVTGKNQQEIHCGVFNNRIDNATHLANTDRTSISRRIYDDEEGRAVFTEGVGCCNVDTE